MSQSGQINISGGGGGGSPILTVTGNSGGPITPTNNNLNLVGGTSTVNDPNGITIVGTLGTSTETVTLTNRFEANTTTTDATPTLMFSFPLGSASCYNFTLNVAVYDRTLNKGAGYLICYNVRTDGTTPFKISYTTPLNSEDTELNPSSFVIANTGNTLTFSVTGLVGSTINWQMVGTYVKAF